MSTYIHTGVLLLALRTTQFLGDHYAVIVGKSERRRKVFLQPLYDKLGLEKSGALINWNALIGCDTTGHIHGKGKKGCFAAFMKANPTILIALAGLGD